MNWINQKIGIHNNPRYVENRYWLLIVSMFFGTINLIAQNDVIQPLSSGGVASLLADDKVENVRILSSSDETLNIEIRYSGYDAEDARYVVSGAILDTKKQVIKEISADPAELAKRAEAVDLSFKVSGSLQSANPYIESKYISVRIQKTENTSEKEGGLLDDLSKLFGSESESSTGVSGLMSDAFLFSFAKTWRVAGNANMVITVNLTPIGKAMH